MNKLHQSMANTNHLIFPGSQPFSKRKICLRDMLWTSVKVNRSFAKRAEASLFYLLSSLCWPFVKSFTGKALMHQLCSGSLLPRRKLELSFLALTYLSFPWFVLCLNCCTTCLFLCFLRINIPWLWLHSDIQRGQ